MCSYQIRDFTQFEEAFFNVLFMESFDRFVSGLLNQYIYKLDME